MANECVPFFDPAGDVTCHVEAAVTGKRFVSISGPRVNGLPQISPTGAAAAAFAVAAYDAAAGVTVPVLRGHKVVPVTSGAAIVAGDPIKADANGKAIPQAGVGVILGYAVDDVAGADLDAAVALNI